MFLISLQLVTRAGRCRAQNINARGPRKVVQRAVLISCAACAHVRTEIDTLAAWRVEPDDDCVCRAKNTGNCVLYA